jgi:hypothetical protein
VLEIDWKNPNEPPQSVLNRRTVLTVTALNAVRIYRKACPEIVLLYRLPYNLYGLLNAVFPRFSCAVELNRTINVQYKSVLYGFSFLLVASKSVPLLLPWDLCHFSAAISSPEYGNFLFSCSLSISQSLLERMDSLLVFFLF